MNAIVLLFSLGIVLLALEVFMPGAVIGVIGGCAMAGGCMVSFSRFGAGSGMLATFIAFALLGAALYAEFVLLPRTRFGRKLFVHATVSSTSQAPLATAEAVVGKSGVALTTLAPSGYVLVEGKRYEAFSQSGHIPKGAALHVVNLDNFRLIVSKT
jgi:membrane-bound ClpP family serine protease